MGKWSLKGQGPRKELRPIFPFGWPGRCRANREKRRSLEGSREVGGSGLIMHRGGVERREREGEEAKPCLIGDR